MNRIKRLFALGASIAVLANPACNGAAPPAGQMGLSSAQGQALTTVGTVSGLSLKIFLYPVALPGEPFAVEVSFRNATGQLMNVSDSVTLRLTTNPTAATLTGTTTRPSVAGVASFPGLIIDKSGLGYILTASSIQGGSATSRTFRIACSEDDEPGLSAGGSLATAREMSPKVPEFRVLGAGEVHYFMFRATVGQLLSVSSYASRVDMADWDTSLRLRLIAPDGTTEIARSGAINADARSVDNGFSMIRIPQEGVYYLACDTDQAGFLSGVYSVVMKLDDKPSLLQIETEPWGATGQNDTHATAQSLLPLATGGPLYGHYDNTAAGAPSSDYYKIVISGPMRVRIDLVAARNGGANGDNIWDGRLDLEDATGRVLWSNDNMNGLDPAIDYIVTVAGTYYVRVTQSAHPASPGTSSPYFLLYQQAAYLPTVAVGGSTIAAATPIAYGANISSSFSAAGDRYFSFAGTAGDLVRLAVQDQTQRQGASLTLNPTAAADAVFLRANGAGGVADVSSGAAFSSPTESQLNVRQTILQATGTYYVRVRSASAGSFGIRVDEIATSTPEVEPNDSFALANSIPGPVSGVIAAAGDTDHFKRFAPAGQLVTVSLLAAPGAGTGSSPLADWGSALMPRLEIRNSLGILLSVTSADRRGESNYAESLQHPLRSLVGASPMIQTTFRTPAAGTYEAVVSDADGQGGPTYFYALSVSNNL